MIAVMLALGPFKMLIKDYQMLLDSYASAVAEGREAKIQAIDMGRRGLHNEGAELMIARLEGKVVIDFATARRLIHLGLRAAPKTIGLFAMKIDGTPFRSIWVDETDHWSVRIIDQTKLPWAIDIVRLTTMEAVAHAIKAMLVRGAPLIGASAAYGVALAMRADGSDADLAQAVDVLGATRPTAINLRWALARMAKSCGRSAAPRAPPPLMRKPPPICDEDVATNQAIGRHGLPLIEARAQNGRRVNVLTHCNAGWIATVDWGTALAPIYMAHDAGIDIHVWVEETRPRNQGASLTAWELGKHGVKHTVITDNAGGHMMQRGDVDLVIVGTDRVTRSGDVANKIGTYLKALAARDNGVPFWVALPSSTIDWTISDGLSDIPIEERASDRGDDHDRSRAGWLDRHDPRRAEGQPAANPAFDVTPARLVSGLITERGLCAANETLCARCSRNLRKAFALLRLSGCVAPDAHAPPFRQVPYEPFSRTRRRCHRHR